MITPELLEYVKQQLAQGVSKDTIYTNLVSSGNWDTSSVNEAFATLGITTSPSVSTTSGAVPVAPVKYAGFWIRWVAFAVDSLILIIPIAIAQFVVGLALAGAGSSGIGIKIISSFIFYPIWWLYYSLMTYYKGATLGKMLVGISVKSDDFQKLSFGRVLIRETIGKFISGIILLIGYIIAGATERKQALHDKFAHSVVVYDDPSKSHRTGLIIGIIIAAILPAIAILGILASVVLASLNVARTKGQDAATMSNLSSIKAEAELYFSNNNNSYSNAKDCSSGMFTDQGIQPLISGIKTDVTCYADGTSYAVSATMSNPSMSYCVDNSGYDGSGVAVDSGSTASCQLQATSSPTGTTPVSAIGNTAGNTTYTYMLPTGWQSTSNTGSGVQATNQASGYALSVSAVTIPASAGNVTSVTDVMNSSNTATLIKKEFPTAVIGNSTLTTLGGEKAIMTTFSAVLTSNTSGTPTQSSFSMLQYNAVHNGAFYTVVFIAPSSEQQSAQSDFAEIVGSFIFK